MFNFRTDMADERNRILRKENNLETVPGIETESIEEENNIKTNKVKVISNEGEKAIGKPIGTYITIDFKNLKIADENDIQKASEVVTKELKKLIAKYIDKEASILVVGLGNEYVTPDSLRSKSCFRNRYYKAFNKICSTIFRKEHKTCKCNSTWSSWHNWNRNNGNNKRNCR